MANIIPLTLPGQNGLKLNVDLEGSTLYYSDLNNNYTNITENPITEIYLSNHPEWKQEDNSYIVPIKLMGGEKIIYYDNTSDKNIGEIKSIIFTDKAVSYPNSNIQTTFIFKCGEDNMYIDYPSRSQIISQPPQFIKGNSYIIKVVNNIFIIEQLSYLISNLTDYTITSGVTINCNEHETFNNITIKNGGTLNADINYTTINNVQAIEDGGKIIFDWTLYPSYYTSETVKFSGSNTNIISNTIFNYYSGEYDLVPTEGYCSNGIFYELDGAYRFAVGSEIIVSSPNVAYGMRYSSGIPINYYGARLHATDSAIIYDAHIGWLGDMDIFSGAIVSNTIVDGTDAPELYRTSRNACELTVWSGGTAINTTVNSLGYLNGTTDGHVLSATVNSGGSIRIATTNDKINDNIIVSSGGYYTQAKNTIVNNLRIEGAEAVDKNKYSELISSGGSIIIPKGPACNITGSGAVISNLYISGHFSNCIYTSYFTSGGEIISGATISNGANINNANITSMTVNGGVINVYNSTYVNQLNISGGNTTNDRPKLMIRDNITSISNLDLQDNAWVVIYNSAQIDNMNISSGNLTSVQVYNNASVNNLTINNCSGAIISNGGKITNCLTTHSGAILKISSGGYIETLTVSRGKLSTFTGASITNLNISSGTGGSAQYTLSGTSITNMLINNGGGTIYTNTIIDNLILSKGYITVSSSIVNSVLFKHRDLVIKPNAVVSNIYCEPGGTNCKLQVSGIVDGLSGTKPSTFVTTLTVYSGGTALNVVSGAYLTVINSGGEIHYKE